MSIQWVDNWSEASVPLLVAGGFEHNGEPIYVGRAPHEESLIPGTLRLETKIVPDQVSGTARIKTQNVCVRWAPKFQFQEKKRNGKIEIDPQLSLFLYGSLSFKVTISFCPQLWRKRAREAQEREEIKL